jgi:hypothetical protein
MSKIQTLKILFDENKLKSETEKINHNLQTISMGKKEKSYKQMIKDNDQAMKLFNSVRNKTDMYKKELDTIQKQQQSEIEKHNDK